MRTISPQEEKILTTAMQLFVANGIKAVSMDDISKKVGISKRTLYEAFASKEELLIQCIEQHHMRKHEAMKQKFSEKSTIIDVLVSAIVDFIEESGRVNPLFFQDLSMTNFSGAFSISKEHEAEDRKNFQALLERGKADGLIRDDVNSEFICDAFRVRGNSHLSHLMANGKWRIVDFLFGLVIPFFRGIATAKGIAEIDKTLANAQNHSQHNK